MSAPVAATRTGLVEGRQVAVFDDLVPVAEIAQYAEALHRAPFTRTEMARPDTAEYRHWVREMPVAMLAELPLVPPTLAAIATMRPGDRYRAYRAYTNHAAYGDMLFTHTDCDRATRELTALWFLCPKWDPEWGGETLFFDQSGDAIFAATPRPGRLVIFDGAIRHAGRPPNRICYAPRYTFALKLEPVIEKATPGAAS